jgi:hypothetical protein
MHAVGAMFVGTAVGATLVRKSIERMVRGLWVWCDSLKGRR